jgi:hypothetical protein
MLEPTNELTPRNYSREDESARRLWLTQRTKANPWEGRRPPDEDNPGAASEVREPASEVPETAAAVIPQTDALLLEASKEALSDPFASLIVKRLNG